MKQTNGNPRASARGGVNKVTGSGGKGSGRLHARQQVSDEQMQANWDKAFSKVKCPECGSKDVELNWIEATFAAPEWQQGECIACEHIWNECAREAEL